MARGNTTQDLSTLQMALVGYEIERQRVEEKIREIRSRLKGKAVSSSATAKPKPGGKRQLSPAALKRISLAQKKRWAAYHKKAAQAAKKA